MSRFAQSIVGVGLLASACVGSEVTYTGVKQPSKPEDCPVKIFPSTTPDYQWEDLASVKAHCHVWEGRTACIDELKKRTCQAGGDTLYGFKDGKEGDNIVVIGTAGLQTGASREKTGGEAQKERTEPAVGAPSAEAPREVAATTSTCEPPCSPGYRCEASQCVAVCNPPCGEGMRCNQQRMCESAAAPAP